MVTEVAISPIAAASSIDALLARRMLGLKRIRIESHVPRGVPMNHTVTLVRAATKKKDLPARKPVKGGMTAKYAK
jgi:hypothetical protein